MKKCKYFGTDGIRGIIGQDFTPELVTRIANATAAYIEKRPARVIIGWDTRASCDFIVHIFSGVLSGYGIDVINVGVVPSAALSFLTNKLGVDLGIMVSASHCSWEYNGLKYFMPTGEKLCKTETYKFDKLIVGRAKPQEPSKTLGTITHDQKAIKLWQTFLVKKFKTLQNSKLKVAIDCAFGSGTECAQEVLKTLGINATFFNSKPTGLNINDGCGATKPSYMRTAMQNGKFDIGFAFDGDADRCIVFDADGNHIHGDIVIYLLAKHLKDRGQLAKNKVVGTILFNLGVEKQLFELGIKFIRTDVGDAYVYHAMKVGNLSMGGETSGHINFADIWCTGDGLVVALMVLAVIVSGAKRNAESVKTRSGLSLTELANKVTLYPQVNINAQATPDQKRKLFADEGFNKFIKTTQAKNKDFRIIVRPSGTENIVRVTVEGADKTACEKIAADIVVQTRKVFATKK